MQDDARQHAEATLENRDDIAAVLERLLPGAVPPGGLVLEVASGSGQHATFFAPRFPWLRWQPSDPSEEARRSCAAWAAHEGVANVLAPVALDATAPTWPLPRADAVFCANMIHISPWEATLGLLGGAARLLPPEGLLILYGPYRIAGNLAESNREFDAWLRRRDPRWGVRAVEEVEAEARRAGLEPQERIPMPWDNLMLALKKRTEAPPASAT